MPHGERDVQVLQAAVERGLISDKTAVEVGARATIEHTAETLLVQEGHLSASQLSMLLASMAAARIEPPPTLGNYRIGAKLGQGGMAMVYQAEQLSLHRPVALKIIGPPHTADTAFCDRFLREARLVAAINHPNVITCFDAGQDQGFLYMALELVSGGDAGRALTADGGRLEEKRALAIAADCCHGLIALEEAGLIHRDIKPGNIFLCRTPTGERAKLADLGLARSSASDDQHTAAGAAMGTPAFMSPEQANGATDVDIRTDIYALGATLYALLTGRSPYQGTTVWSVMAQVLKDPVPDPRAVQPAISNASASIVIHCLAKERGERYAGPRQMLEDLEAAAAGKAPRHARLIPHPSSSWDPLAASGPMPRYASREHPTVNVPQGPIPADRPRDELGVEQPAGAGARWLLLGAVAGGLVVGLGILAANLAPHGDPPPLRKPAADAGQSVETELSALADDPLRPRPAPPVAPASHPFGPGDLAGDPAKPPSAPAATPEPVAAVRPVPTPGAAVAVAPRPQPAPAPRAAPPAEVVAPEPASPVAPQAPVATEPQPAPAPVPVPVQVDPEPEPAPVAEQPAEAPGPAEIPASPALHEVIEAPSVATATPAAPIAAPAAPPLAAPPLDLAAVTAYVQVREKELNRNGFACRLVVLPSGNVAAILLDKGITDLTPLHGLKIERFDATGCERLEGDLGALTGMPLRSLALGGCKRLGSLRGVRGAPLVELTIAGCAALGPDLAQLSAAHLSGRLDLAGCRGLTSLDGLQGQPLGEIAAKGCDGLTSVAGLRGCAVKRLDLRGCSALTSLTGLEGLPLEELRLDGAKRLAGDLGALRGAPLRVLGLRDCGRLTDLDGIQGAPLTDADLAGCDSLLSLAALKGSKLTRLDLSGCSSLRTLDGLQGVPLVELRLYGCRSLTGDFAAVRGAPLQLVDASYCSQMTSLRGLEQSPLRKLVLTRNTGITDYTELAGVKGLEIVR